MCITLLTFSQLPTNGLVGNWPFNGNANDESGNGNNGSVFGATLTTDRFGNVNSAYNFDGINDFITVADNVYLKPTKVSISVWVKLNGTTCTQTGGNSDMASVIFKKNSHSSYFEGYMIGYRTDLNKFHGLASNGANATCFSNTTTINVWKHIVITIDSNILKFYENGVLLDSESTNFSLNYGTAPLCFGSTQLNYDGFFNGVIDDIGIWNRILTQKEVYKLYVGCTNFNYNDTTSYYVSNKIFESLSPEIYFKRTDSLTTTIGCDSIINRYSKFIYNPNYFTDTLSVEDTLNIMINVSINPTPDINEVKLYPNPTKDNLWVDCGNYLKMNNFQIKILNSSGAVIWSSYISQQIYIMDISNYTKGLYFFEIFDSTNNKIITKKIVLQ